MIDLRQFEKVEIKPMEEGVVIVTISGRGFSEELKFTTKQLGYLGIRLDNYYQDYTDNLPEFPAE